MSNTRRGRPDASCSTCRRRALSALGSALGTFAAKDVAIVLDMSPSAACQWLARNVGKHVARVGRGVYRVAA